MKKINGPHKAYFFGNMYISQIAHGIQAAHTLTEMFVKYKDGIENKILFDWAENDKVMILFNGGYQSNLYKIHSIFEVVGDKLRLPFAKFHEEEDALNCALTSVGIIVPETYRDSSKTSYDSAKPTIDQLLAKTKKAKISEWECTEILRAVLDGGRLV